MRSFVFSFVAVRLTSRAHLQRTALGAMRISVDVDHVFETFGHCLVWSVDRVQDSLCRNFAL
jgi:hypothetical protein